VSVVIGLVSESLKNLLEAKMDPTAKVTLLSPAEDSSLLKRVNLFPYRLAPSAFLANRDFQPIPGEPGRVQAPPLGLSVFYLMTAHAQADPETGDADAQGLLAEAMRVLHEHAIVPESFLETGLVPGTIKITLQPADVEEVSKVWTALSKPYQLCAVYEVATVDLASVATRPIAPRVARTDVALLAGGRRPEITAMSPRSGPVGTTLEFAGADLTGWAATVSVGGRDASPDEPIEDNAGFTADVPAGLAVGRYLVEVDVAGLASYRSEFEVTP
jgi:hypothetical protein